MESPRAALTSLKQGILVYVHKRAFFMDAGAFVIALLLGRIEIFGVLLPFGAAFVAGADMAGQNAVFPFMGAIIGMAVLQPPGYAALFGTGLYMLLRVLYPLVFRRLARVDKLLLMGVAQVLTLPVFYLGSTLDFMRGVSGAAFALLLAISYQNALRAISGLSVRQKLHEEEQIALCLLIGSVALAASELSAHAFSLSIVIIAWAAMFAAFSKGLAAVAAAVTLGALLLLGGKAQPLLLADLALCTMAGILLRRMGIWGTVLGFCVGCAVTEAYLGGTGQQIGLINALPAALALVCIPKKGILWLRATVDSEAKEERTARAMLSRLQTQAAEDIVRTAKTVEQVADLFPRQAQWAHDVERERMDMQRAVMNVCLECNYRGSCWREREVALDAVQDMLGAYASGKRPRAHAPLRSECPYTISIAAAATQARDAYREQCVQAHRAAEQHAFINRQLHGVGNVMRKLSVDVAEQEWPDEMMAQLVKRRLEREGIFVKDVLVRQKKEGLLVEMRLPRKTQEAQKIEDALTRVLERPMRLLYTQNTPRERILTFEQAQRVKVAFGAATTPKRGSTLSGDSTGSAALPNGGMLFVLSDGMGSGAAAREQSAAAVDMLIKLYEVGYERDTSLECVNRLLIGKGERDMYATLDALHLDMKSGHAEFVKCGSPPSFVLRAGKVHTIYAEALPAGILDEATPAVHAATLKRNDAVVLLTDGALDALGEDAAEEILTRVGGANTCEDAAKALLEAARERGAEDDMSVVVVRLE